MIDSPPKSSVSNKAHAAA